MEKNTKKQKKNIFQRKGYVVLFAMTCAMVWASAFPLIKIGFQAFDISAENTGGKTLFAGVRFLGAGLLLLGLAKVLNREKKKVETADYCWLVLFGIVNTALHYFFFYVGLSHCSGSRSAIFDSLSTFFLIVLACIFFKDEHMTWSKVLGCMLGFLGVLVINVGTGLGEQFSVLGDGMLLLSATCSAFGGILTRIITKKVDTLFATGWSLAFGGVVLIVAGCVMGRSFRNFQITGFLVLGMLILVSAIGFSLYNQLICYNPVGKIAIFNSFIPILGTILSCLILKEPFYIRYIVAGLLVAAGVYVVQKGGQTSRKKG